MNAQKIKLVVVDDHALFRRGLMGLLEEMPEFCVVGEAGNGLDAVQVIRNTRPDIVLMDVNMPQMDGIEAVQKVRELQLPVKILMLTISRNDQDLLGAVRSGADGYLLKNAEPDDLRSSLLRIHAGQGVLSPEVTAPLLHALANVTNPVQNTLLSDRERDVLKCMADGQTTIQISSTLYISENTVKTHVRHILEKLDAANRTEAVSKALQLGLLNRDHRG